MITKPTILGGKPIFENPVNIVSPTLPSLDSMKDRIEETLKNGMITNFSRYSQEFEKKTAEYFCVKYALSQSNATSGLLILQKILNLTGEVIVPSFTFSATTHTLIWNNLTPVFVDINKETFNIDPKLIEEKITPKTSAIYGVHIFGNPCEINELQKIADKHNLKLIFDSAHAFGSLYHGKKVGGFGDAEVFSLSATKLLTTGEGGIITTNNPKLYEKLKLGRNYGDPGTYDCQFVGFNSKLPEYGAIMGLETLKILEEGVERRNQLFELCKSTLGNVPGITFQKITENCRTTVKDLAIVIDKNKFGISRDKLAEALDKENIRTKKYFYPPIHLMKAYSQFYDQYNGKLPNTEYLSQNILCLPIHSHMADETMLKICKAIKRIHEFAGEIK